MCFGGILNTSALGIISHVIARMIMLSFHSFLTEHFVPWLNLLEQARQEFVASCVSEIPPVQPITLFYLSVWPQTEIEGRILSVLQPTTRGQSRLWGVYDSCCPSLYIIFCMYVSVLVMWVPPARSHKAVPCSNKSCVTVYSLII